MSCDARANCREGQRERWLAHDPREPPSQEHGPLPSLAVYRRDQQLKQGSHPQQQEGKQTYRDEQRDNNNSYQVRGDHLVERRERDVNDAEAQQHADRAATNQDKSIDVPSRLRFPYIERQDPDSTRRPDASRDHRSCVWITDRNARTPATRRWWLSPRFRGPTFDERRSYASAAAPPNASIDVLLEQVMNSSNTEVHRRRECCDGPSERGEQYDGTFLRDVGSSHFRLRPLSPPLPARQPWNDATRAMPLPGSRTALWRTASKRRRMDTQFESWEEETSFSPWSHRLPVFGSSSPRSSSLGSCTSGSMQSSDVECSTLAPPKSRQASLHAFDQSSRPSDLVISPPAHPTTELVAPLNNVAAITAMDVPPRQCRRFPQVRDESSEHREPKGSIKMRRERVVSDQEGSNGIRQAITNGKRCTIEGCTCRAQSRGLCWKHGGYTICTMADCSKRAKSRGLCWSHGGGTRCRTEGCDKIAVSKGRCWAHGGGKRCKLDQCQKPAATRTRDFCTEHFRLWSEMKELHAEHPMETNIYL